LPGLNGGGAAAAVPPSRPSHIKPLLDTTCVKHIPDRSLAEQYISRINRIIQTGRISYLTVNLGFKTGDNLVPPTFHTKITSTVSDQFSPPYTTGPIASAIVEGLHSIKGAADKFTTLKKEQYANV